MAVLCLMATLCSMGTAPVPSASLVSWSYELFTKRLSVNVNTRTCSLKMFETYCMHFFLECSFCSYIIISLIVLMFYLEDKWSEVEDFEVATPLLRRLLGFPAFQNLSDWHSPCSGPASNAVINHEHPSYRNLRADHCCLDKRFHGWGYMLFFRFLGFRCIHWGTCNCVTSHIKIQMCIFKDMLRIVLKTIIILWHYHILSWRTMAAGIQLL